MGRFRIRQTRTGYVFHLLASNNEVVATSEVYSSIHSCKKGVEAVRRNAPIAALSDLTAEAPVTARNPKFEVFLDRSGRYRFRLKAGNGEIIAVSEGYRARAGCLGGIESVRSNAPDAVTVVEE